MYEQGKACSKCPPGTSCAKDLCAQTDEEQSTFVDMYKVNIENEVFQIYQVIIRG